jgi:hypothetical protein
MTFRHSIPMLRFALIVCLAAPASLWADDPPALPDFAVVSQAVLGYFSTIKGYQPGDLVNQSQVDGALDAVAAAGWEVPNPRQIVGLALSDNAWLVRELATPKGQSFMRKVGKHDGGYQRLDRLSEIADGKNAIRILIKDPGGDKMIEYMDTTPGGKNLGQMMGGAKKGVDLNKPTGRIYTADDLVAVLQGIYAQIASQPL